MFPLDTPAAPGPLMTTDLSLGPDMGTVVPHAGLHLASEAGVAGPSLTFPMEGPRPPAISMAKWSIT